MQFTNAAWQDGPFNKPAVWYCCPPMVTVPVGSSWEESELPASPLSRNMILSVTNRQYPLSTSNYMPLLKTLFYPLFYAHRSKSYPSFHFKRERELKLSLTLKIKKIYGKADLHPLLLSCWLSSLTEPYLIFLLHLIH